jgi:hypothetical protein
MERRMEKMRNAIEMEKNEGENPTLVIILK